MATVGLVTTELAGLLAQSKKKHAALVKLLDASLEVLKKYPAGINETTFFLSLSKPDQAALVAPFIWLLKGDHKQGDSLSGSKLASHLKHSTVSIQTLRALVSINALNLTQLASVLAAIEHALSLQMTTELSVKVLQITSLIVQSYRDALDDQTWTQVLRVCATQATRAPDPNIVRTATATLQQVLMSLFDAADSAPAGTIHRKAKLDLATTIYDDLCRTSAHRAPTLLLHMPDLPVMLSLELFECVLANHSQLFVTTQSLAAVVQSELVPLLQYHFEYHQRHFGVMVRVCRLLYLVVTRLLALLDVQGEVVLSMVAKVLASQDKPYWTRVLFAELCQGLFADAQLVLSVFSAYDSTPDRSDVLHDLLAAFQGLLADGRPVLGYDERLSSATELVLPQHVSEDLEYAGPGISMSYSPLKVRLMDMLDDAEQPPDSLPPSYIYYLIATGLGRLSAALSALDLSPPRPSSPFAPRPLVRDSRPLAPVSQVQDPADHRANLFLNSCWTILFNMHNILFCSIMDAHMFGVVVQSARQLCEVSAVFSVPEPRDRLLRLFADFCIRTTRLSNGEALPPPSSSSLRSSILSGVEDFVGQFSSNDKQNDKQYEHNGRIVDPNLRPRISTINRMAIEALLSIGITTGQTLGTSWTVILRTVVYFRTVFGQPDDIDAGPQESLTVFAYASKSNRDLDLLLNQLCGSTALYDRSQFSGVLQAQIELVASILNQTPGSESVSLLDPLFALRLLEHLCHLNSARLVTGPHALSEVWSQVSKYLEEVLVDWHLDDDIRHKATVVLGDLLLLVLEEADKSQIPVSRQVFETAKHAIQALLDSASVMDQDPNSSGIMASTAFDLHLILLDKFCRLLDQYGGKMDSADGWDVALDIMDTPFHNPLQDAAQTKRPHRLVRSAFGALQLVCNDFLAVLPATVTVQLVDLFTAFCSQQKDLNISFTSISFFWGLSDHLMGKLQPGAMDRVIESESELLANAKDWAWMVLLLRLASISEDPRSQVRNGAVQTLFRIFESHGKAMDTNMWMTAQATVLPRVTQVRGIRDDGNAAEWNDTIALTVTSLSSLYSLFLATFLKQTNFSKNWVFLLSYYQDVVSSTQVTDYALAAPVYEGLAKCLANIDCMPVDCLDMTWDFYRRQAVIQFGSQDARVVQDGLTGLVKLHESLSRLGQGSMPDANYASAIEILGLCCRYAVLPAFYSDQEHLSIVQKAAFERFETLDAARTPDTACQVVAELAKMIVMPLNRLPHDASQDRRFTVPTFLSLGFHALDLVARLLDGLGQYYGLLCSGGQMEELVVSLTRVMGQKYFGPEQGGVQLWQRASTVFVELVGCVGSEFNDGLWMAALEGPLTWLSRQHCERSSNPKLHEEFDMESYQELMRRIDTLQCHIPELFWARLIDALHEASKTYTRDIETPANQSALEWLVKPPFYGSTVPVKVLPRHGAAKLAFKELSRLFEQKQTHEIRREAATRLLERCASVLRQFVSDQPLRGQRPMARVEQYELLLVLETLAGHVVHERQALAPLWPLVIRASSLATGKAMDPLQRLLEGLIS